MNGNANRILHLAAKSPPASMDQIIKSNIVYVQEIVKYAVDNKIEEMIFFSAMSLYGKQNKEDVAEEDNIVEPGIYGISKLLGEEILRNSPLKVLSIRLPAILGYRNTTNFLSRCYMKLKNNEDIELTNHDRVFNNFISVENIFEFLAEFRFTGKFDILNLASRKMMTIIDVVELMKETMKSRSEIIINSEKQPFFNVSTNKAESEYSFKPQEAEVCITGWLQQRLTYEMEAVH